MFKATGQTARQGLLTLGGHEIATPNFIVPSLRGGIPHLTPDNQPQVPGVAVFAEEFYDTKGPVAAINDRNQLPLVDGVLIASANRPDGPRPSKPNTNDNLAVQTQHGTKVRPIVELSQYMVKMNPDMMIVPHDGAIGSPGAVPGNNRLRKMKQRGIEWVQLFAKHREQANGKWPLIASISPELCNKEYIDELGSVVDGIYLVPSDAAAASNHLQIPEYAGLRVCGKLQSPSQVLDGVLQGFDLFYASIDEYTNKGQALTFALDASTEDLLIDLHDSKYVTDMTKLGQSSFAKAYIHHLLNAKEMTAQVVLQQHNLGVISRFFADIRASLEAGTLEKLSAAFKAHYKTN